MPIAVEGFLAARKNGAHSPAKEVYTDWNIMNQHKLLIELVWIKLFKSQFYYVV